MTSIGKARAIPLLLRTLVDRDARVRYLASESLVMLGWQAENNEQRAAYFAASGDLVHAARLGESGAKALAQVLRTGVYQKRVEAAHLLADTKDPQAVKPLLEALSDPDGSVRVAAAEALGNLRDFRAVEPLIRQLKGQVTNVRCAAALALGFLGDEQAGAPLLELTKDPNAEIRLAATEALGRLRPSQ